MASARILASATVIDNVAPADSLKTGADNVNAHWHQYDAVLLTNSAAGSTAVGDVLAVSTAGDSAAILGDTVRSLQKYVVAQAVIANAATGEFARSGVVTALANGAIARGQYIRKSATARSVEDAGTAIGATAAPPVGALGVALAAAAGGTVLMYLFDKTVTHIFANAYSALYDAGTGSLAWTPDCLNGNVQQRTANATGTLVTPSNPAAGMVLVLIFVQDGTGSRVITWPSTFHFPSGTEPTLSTAANAIDVWSGVYNGTNWLGALSKDHKA